MANGNGNQTVVWKERALAAVEVANKLGAVSVLVLVLLLFILFATGVLRFTPLEQISASVKEVAQALGTLATKDEADRIAGAQMAAGLTEINMRSRLIDCDRIVTPDIRALCLAPFRKPECPP